MFLFLSNTENKLKFFKDKLFEFMKNKNYKTTEDMDIKDLICLETNGMETANFINSNFDTFEQLAILSYILDMVYNLHSFEAIDVLAEEIMLNMKVSEKILKSRNEILRMRSENCN